MTALPIVFLLPILAAIPANARDVSLEIDYASSSIEIEGKAARFFPAVFRFNNFEAKADFDASLETLVGAEFRFDYREITSGSARKDRRIRAWLEAEKHPNGSFKLERTENIDGDQFAIGQLLLHGQWREARFLYTVESAENETTLNAVAKIDYRDWNLPELRILLFKIEPTLEIRILLRGKAI